MTTHQTLRLLREYESRNVTFIAADGSWPIVWERARGVHVWDAAGRKYLDLTAAFGVAAAGHANPRVVRAGQRQMARLLHAMGDVHPHALKARLARELSRITFERWKTKSRVLSLESNVRGPRSEVRGPKSKVRGPKSKVLGPKSKVQSLEPTVSGRSGAGVRGKTILCNSGFEAVEAALKTAMLARGKPGVVAFEGAYHGLGYGALNVTQRGHFRSPFRRQLREFGHFVPFPKADKTSCAVGGRGEIAAVQAVESQIRRLFRREKIGAVLVEPIQVRGGVNVPPPGFLPMLRRLCDEHGALLILDEIYTGFGRTGQWFACEHSGTVPDLICLGKALTGGFPLSACVGRADVMDAAWPPSSGEAIHTSTFLGHPVGCAMALAQVREIEGRDLVRSSAELGQVLLSRLSAIGGFGRASVRASPDCAGDLKKNRGSRGRSPSRMDCLYTASDVGGYTLSARGVGLLAGLEVCLADGSPATRVVLGIVKALLRQGFIFLPEGEDANVISFTPPLTITEHQLRTAVDELGQELHRYKVT